MRYAHVTEALDAAGLSHPEQLWRNRRYPSDDTVLEAGWGPEASPFYDSWSAGDRFIWVWIHDVPSGERAAAERELRRVAIPELVERVRYAESAPDGWRLLRHHWRWRWTEGRVVTVPEGR